MRYSEIEPYASGLIDVADGHRLYWECSGNPDGKPIVVIHGGPGGQSTPGSRRWFDPRTCRIIVFDQRGCGRSLPHRSVTCNTTADLIRDIEAIRTAAGVDRWSIMGHSWGSTLALAYAQTCPERVTSLLLASVFTARRQEIDWLYAGGAARDHRPQWLEFLRAVDLEDGEHDVLSAYRARLTSGDPLQEVRAARAWCLWEHTLAAGAGIGLQESDMAVRARATIGVHYMANHVFLSEGQLIAGAHRLRRIPGFIVQGSADKVTPPSAARALHKAWPLSRLELIDDGGHLTSQPAIMRALVNASDALASA